MKMEYTNYFNCVVNRDGEEVILQFKQNSPKIEINPDDIMNITQTGMQQEDIATIVMNLKCAENLVRVINEGLYNSIPEG